jgi:hypothetical protein
MGWELFGDVDVGVRHPGPKVNGVSTSIRHEYSLLSGEFTHTATASRGNIEIVGGALANPELANALELSGYDFHSKIGGVKHDFNVRPGVVGGWTINTDGSAGVRAGLGNTTYNAYVEVTAGIKWVVTAALDRLIYKSEFDASDNRDKVAGEAIASNSRVSAADNDPLGFNADPNVEYYDYQDRQSGAQVRTKVVADPVTGQKRAVYSTVVDSNPEQSALRGNTYPPGKVQAGYELNALDRISEERNVWNNTPDSTPTGPQGNGSGPSDLNDPRGPWQIPGAPGDRTIDSGAAKPSAGAGSTAPTKGAVTPGKTKVIQTPAGPQVVSETKVVDTPAGKKTVVVDSHYTPKVHESSRDKATTTTTVSKNSDGYTKTTTTKTYNSGVSSVTTKQTVSTPAGPKQVTKTETKAAPAPKNDPKKFGPQPVLLDLDGNGVKITEFDRSSQFMTGKDGLQHRTSWAGAGDGVLFYDPDGRNAITEHRQYVFTEWNPTAAGDLEAIRSIWDTNGDGKLTAADADFAKFKVLVTNADGSTTVMTLAQLGITEINLTANAVNIELPDGTVITGQTTFTRSNGTTGTVANTTLTADAVGYRWDRQLRLAA